MKHTIQELVDVLEHSRSFNLRHIRGTIMLRRALGLCTVAAMLIVILAGSAFAESTIKKLEIRNSTTPKVSLLRAGRNVKIGSIEQQDVEAKDVESADQTRVKNMLLQAGNDVVIGGSESHNSESGSVRMFRRYFLQAPDSWKRIVESCRQWIETTLLMFQFTVKTDEPVVENSQEAGTGVKNALIAAQRVQSTTSRFLPTHPHTVGVVKRRDVSSTENIVRCGYLNGPACRFKQQPLMMGKTGPISIQGAIQTINVQQVNSIPTDMRSQVNHGKVGVIEVH